MRRTQLGSLTADHTVYECAKCLATECDHPEKLRRRGWVTHTSRATGKPWTLTLCRRCNPPIETFSYKADAA